MINWWNDLSARERVLVMIACGLAAALALSLLVARPLMNWNASSERKAMQARDAYELTAAAAAVTGPATSGAAANTPLRQAIISTAGSAGIELVRIGSASDSQIEIQAAPADAEILFNWFADLERRYGVSVTFADMTRGEGGLVNSQVLIFERRS